MRRGSRLWNAGHGVPSGGGTTSPPSHVVNRSIDASEHSSFPNRGGANYEARSCEQDRFTYLATGDNPVIRNLRATLDRRLHLSQVTVSNGLPSE